MNTNVDNVGHTKEQPTKVSSFRPQLAVFAGYSYQRTSQGVIEVWVPCSCEICEQEIYISGQFVRVGDASDILLQRHGLKLFEGQKPVYGGRVHTSSPIMCTPCRDRWLKGEALEHLGQTKVVETSWS